MKISVPVTRCAGLALLNFLLAFSLAAGDSIPSSAIPALITDTRSEPVATGKFEANWQSLAAYQVPEWFRDAKLGLWAHWGPQCQPEQGDWYARGLYTEDSGQNKFHVEHYGHPSEFGFKDVIHEWKAEKWDPDRIVALYKRVGAKYFFAMANHHDNLDLWDSKYQPWNSLRVGPGKDLIAGWARAARAQGLPFGVSVHAAHAWSWYEMAQSADKEGTKAGVSYDGRLSKADGKGKWWEGLDPQDLYEQRHTPSDDFGTPNRVHSRWNWGDGVRQPDAAYCERFYNRTMDLINRYKPELLYFDDTALPLWPVSDAGLKIAAHFYNTNLDRGGGVGAGVIFGKILDDVQRKALVWDIERGVPSNIQPDPWQTCTCIGSWHYNRSIYERNGYKSARTVIHMLADIVSKNGNLLLNVPVRGDGSIDEQEESILEEIAAWMAVNKEGIFATRPWKIFGEGPASAGQALSGQGFNEGKGKPFTAEDVRYTMSKDGRTLYALVLGWTEKALVLKSLGKEAKLVEREISKVELLGVETPVVWEQFGDALVIQPCETIPSGPTRLASVYRVTMR